MLGTREADECAVESGGSEGYENHGPHWAVRVVAVLHHEQEGTLESESGGRSPRGGSPEYRQESE